MTRRERRVVEHLIDAAVAAGDPLPAPRDTDAVAAFDAWLRAAPAPNRLALRALLRVVGTDDLPRRIESGKGLRGRGRAVPRPDRRALLLRRRARDAGARLRRGRSGRAGAGAAAGGGTRVTGGLLGGRRATPRTSTELQGRDRPPFGSSGGREIRGRRRLSVDAVVVGTGAGGARRREGARRGGSRRRDARGGRVDRAGGADGSPARPLAALVPRRRAGGHGRHARDPAPARPRGRRHDDPQLGHVLPHAARAARELGPVERGGARPVLPPRRADVQRLPRPARDRRRQRPRDGTRGRRARAGPASTCTARRAGASAPASAPSAAPAAASSTPATRTCRWRGTPARPRSPARG